MLNIVRTTYIQTMCRTNIKSLYLVIIIIYLFASDTYNLDHIRGWSLTISNLMHAHKYTQSIVTNNNDSGPSSSNM